MANGIEVRQSLTLLAPPQVLYDFWRRLSEFPRFMRHVESVEELDERRSHWIVRGPGNRRIEWDAEIVEDIPGRLIRWRTVGDPDVRHGGRVEFRPASGGRGTVAEVHLAYEPPGGGAGAAYAKMLGDDPKQQIREDLRRFKMLVETGEISTIVGQTSARDEDDREDAGEGPGVGATERETEDYRDDVRGTSARGEKGEGMVMETSTYEVRSMEDEAEDRERVEEPESDEDEVRS
jgi:uncharacterized membrane protein